MHLNGKNIVIYMIKMIIDIKVPIVLKETVIGCGFLVDKAAYLRERSSRYLNLLDHPTFDENHFAPYIATKGSNEEDDDP